jgi:hypothetical protein
MCMVGKSYGLESGKPRGMVCEHLHASEDVEVGSGAVEMSIDKHD